LDIFDTKNAKDIHICQSKKKKAAKMACVLMEVKLIGPFRLKRSLNDRRQASCSKGKQTKINTAGAKGILMELK
jgi:hypothetical protein